MNKSEAQAKIAELTKTAQTSLKDAASIADRYGIEFAWDFEYGMSGHYYPKKPMSREDALRLVEGGSQLSDVQREQIAVLLRSAPADGEDWEESSGYEGWTSSSEMC